MNNKGTNKIEMIKLPISPEWLERVAVFFSCMIFGLGSLTVFNFLFTLLGVGRYATQLSILVFSILYFVLILYSQSKYGLVKILQRNRLTLIFVILYGIPTFLISSLRGLGQYILLITPFSLLAMLILYSDRFNEIFFEKGKVLARLFSIASIIYIILRATGVYSLPVMTYGNVSWLFLAVAFFLIHSIIVENYKIKTMIIDFIILAILVLSICLTGLRSGVICIFWAPIIIFLCNGIASRFSRGKLVKMIICLLIAGAIVPLTVNMEIQNNRMSYLSKNTIFELKKEQIPEKKADPNHIVWPQSSYLFAFDLTDNRIKTMTNFYYEHTRDSDYSLAEIEQFVKEDLKGRNKKWLLVEPSRIDEAIDFKVRFNRGILWPASLDMWRKSPLWGNGPGAFQLKYTKTFPHNIVLELLCDYGVIGLGVILIVLFFLLGRVVYLCKKTENVILLDTIGYALCFFPFYLLYTAAYANGTLLFLISLLLGGAFIKNEQVLQKRQGE